ncbi:MAG: hypothetical protein GPJ21_24035 [Microcystis aeruginosa W13-11]|jgi:hypothetical protein|nr:hypothetical protein [Microcystis aeruginosa W13-11]
MQKSSVAFLLKILVAVSTILTVASYPQTAKADLFCYPWERGCKVDGNPGSSGNDPVGNPRDGFIIYVTSNTGRTIFVTVKAYVSDPSNESCSELNQNIPVETQSLFAYVGENLLTQQNINSEKTLLARCAFHGWQTFGTYTFSPGERALILNGSNRVTGRNATFSAYSQDGARWEKTVDMGDYIGEFEFTFR